MKIFIDTNIILEYLLDREESGTVDRVLLWADEHKCELFISAGTAYTLTYSIDKYLRKECLVYNPERTKQLRDIMKNVFGRYNVASMDSDGFSVSVSDNSFWDLEDSYQWRVALTCNCDVLVTLNVRDFANVRNASYPMLVLTPAEFEEKYCS